MEPNNMSMAAIDKKYNPISAYKIGTRQITWADAWDV